jgi:antitoxin HicB
MADRNATVPPVRERSLGSPDELADEKDCARPDLRLSGTTCSVAWIHQEDAGYGGQGYRIGAQAPKGAGVMSKKHMGSSIDDFLKEEGIFEEAQAQAVKEVVAWQLAEAMKKRKISKARMAALLKTSRTQIDRLLDPKSDITLSSLQRAAAMVGRRLTIELV